MRWTLIILAGLLVVTLFDGLVQHALPSRTSAYYEHLEQKGWYGVFRAMGHLLTWFLIATVVVTHDRRSLRDRPFGERIDRGVRVLCAPIVGGIAAEILKLILRRERPGAGDMLYTFKPLGEGVLSSSNVGLPSSHTTVAFAGAALAAYAFPFTAPVILIAAAGCAATRVLAGAHHLSDVYVGMVVGVLCARWVWRIGKPRSPMDWLP